MCVDIGMCIVGIALGFEVTSKRKKGRWKRTWKKLVEEESMRVGLCRKDALCRSEWIFSVDEIAGRLR